MKRTIAIVAILAAISLPVMAKGKYQDITPEAVLVQVTELAKSVKVIDDQTSAELDTLSKAVGDLQKRNAALEKKVTHITRILKLKQEQGK